MAAVEHESARIAAGRKTASAQVYDTQGRPRMFRRLDSDAPRLTILARVAHHDIATEVDQAAQARRDLLDAGRSLIHRILLTDTTEVDLHAGTQL
jgi:hypothetical protein